MSVLEQLHLSFVGLRMKIAFYLQTKQDELKASRDASWTRFAKNRNDIHAKDRLQQASERLAGHERRMALFERVFPKP